MEKEMKLVLWSGTENSLTELKEIIINASPTMESCTVGLDCPDHWIRRLEVTTNGQYHKNGIHLASEDETTVDSPRVRLNLDGKFMGDEFYFYIHAFFNNAEPPERIFEKTIPVKGENPSLEVIKSYLDNASVFAICKAISKGKMFDDEKKPFYVNGGFGVMGIKNPTMIQLFNWKKNLDKGRDVFNQKKSEAKEIPAKLRAENSEWAKIPDFTERELTIATYQAYGGGKDYWLPSKKRSLFSSKYFWMENPDGTVTNFAKKCIAEEG